jgi:hypothetical protein
MALINWAPKKLLYTKNTRSCAKLGITKPLVILSFDCDTPEDSLAGLKIAKIMKDKNIEGVFAVPGETLQEGLESYKEISQLNFEFLNHGYKKHAQYDSDKNRYYSVTWYKNMPTSQIEEDIFKGHTTLKELLGIEATGFRAPHFGTLTAANLGDIYKFISSLNYKYSSSSTPMKGLTKGSSFKESANIWEFPLSGCTDSPTSTFDSWGYFMAPDKKYAAKDYFERFKKTIDFFIQNDLPILLNWYVDPSHVHLAQEFYDSLDYAKSYNVEFTTYTKFIRNYLS